jgi:hypothetical protein
VLFGCAPQDEILPGDKWDYADLRTISDYGDVDPQLDFIAGYTRVAGRDLQIRLDFIDLQITANYDIYLALDTKPGGTSALPIDGVAEIEWDTLLILPASGIPKALFPGSQPPRLDESVTVSGFVTREDLIPRIIRIPWQDYILTSLNLSSFPESRFSFKLQAFSTEEGSSIIKDSIGPFRSDALPPARAPLVLAFWNTFPAYTPAQSLRRWDGAHTGPYGERHGLYILLNNVRKTNVPVILLDLRQPTSLSALDYMGALPLIQELEKRDLLVLPDLLPGSPTYPYFPIGLPDYATSRYLEDITSVSKKFGLKSSDILYAPNLFNKSAENYRLVFTPLDDTNIDHYSESGFLPVPHEKNTQVSATIDGLAVPIRKLLLRNAMDLNDGLVDFPLLILGGSLLESVFGDPQSAAASLSYISNHPWIHPLDKDELRSLPSRTAPQILPGTTSPSQIELFSPSVVLENLPDPVKYPNNPLYKSAWDSVFSLYAPLPPEPETLALLRSNYTGQSGITLEAASWADDPRPRQDCSTDLDNDGTNECILASDRIFAVFDLEGARLLAYYLFTGNEIHQIVGPTTQFIVGLADPSVWRIDAGEGADTAGIHGAFVDQPAPWNLFDVTLAENFIEFTSPDNLVMKRFSLLPTGMRVEYHNPNSLNLQIPIAIDPWTRRSPGWFKLHSEHTISNGYLIRFDDQTEVEIITDAPMTVHNFQDSQAKLAFPEDPNYDYPQGHYVPYPMTILDINSADGFILEINTPSLR